MQWNILISYFISKYGLYTKLYFIGFFYLQFINILSFRFIETNIHKHKFKIFLYIFSKIRFNYSTALYEFYDSNLMDISQGIVKGVCSNIKMLDVPDDQFEYIPNIDNVNMGTTLFEVYLVIKRYNTLGKSILKTKVFSTN